MVWRLDGLCMCTCDGQSLKRRAEVELDRPNRTSMRREVKDKTGQDGMGRVGGLGDGWKRGEGMNVTG